ncbi:CMRF35-like molecule 2 [Echinops telfairi]|uniref:CMRF35-like molecule 2 n=1 Tax=Echinops telfairi TaxID=9371 RepID=A0ABM0IWH3_ECHTE|nr:CMRF35-like molecule 2 [Echinops telfairi]
MWLPPVLLLLGLQGCLPLTGPDSVTGAPGGSVSVQCRYEEVYRGSNKYWCRGPYDLSCDTVVETKGGAREERNGRVSIRDHAENLTFTVTMENLTAGDDGPYWCRIQSTWILDVLSYDPSVRVNVSVSAENTIPAVTPPTFLLGTAGQNLSTCEMFTHHPQSLLCSVHFLLLVFLKVPLFLSMLTAVLWMMRGLHTDPGARLTQPVQVLPGPLQTHDPRQHPRSLFSSVHFLLLVFLKVPLFLSMLGAVLWVNRPQRAPEGGWISQTM